ncbi:MAG: response regulator [Acidobacteriales bacterium]|nr:response regulator [Terriglobales bacterium]
MDRDAAVVLVVEDNESSATTLELALSNVQGLKVVLAATAQDALHLLGEAMPAVRAIVTDLNMPRMSGFELIEHIRRDLGNAVLPIIVVSGDTDPESPVRARAAGADAYFSKPFSPARLKQKLEQLLHENQARHGQ